MGGQDSDGRRPGHEKALGEPECTAYRASKGWVVELEAVRLVHHRPTEYADPCIHSGPTRMRMDDIWIHLPCCEGCRPDARQVGCRELGRGCPLGTRRRLLAGPQEVVLRLRQCLRSQLDGPANTGPEALGDMENPQRSFRAVGLPDQAGGQYCRPHEKKSPPHPAVAEAPDRIIRISGSTDRSRSAPAALDSRAGSLPA